MDVTFFLIIIFIIFIIIKILIIITFIINSTILISILRCDSSSMVDYGLDGLSSTMSELHYGSRASSPGGSVLRDYR